MLTNHLKYGTAVLGEIGLKPGTSATPTTGICGKQFNTQIKAAGFIPLALGPTGSQFPSVNSYCREQ